jgi:hypothetical protein
MLNAQTEGSLLDILRTRNDTGSDLRAFADLGESEGIPKSALE